MKMMTTYSAVAGPGGSIRILFLQSSTCVSQKVFTFLHVLLYKRSICLKIWAHYSPGHVISHEEKK